MSSNSVGFSLDKCLSCFRSQPQIPPPSKGVCDIVYATGSGISSAIKGVFTTGINSARTVVSLSLGITSGATRVMQKTALVGGSLVTLVAACDGYVHLTGTHSVFHRMNDCNIDKNFPTILNTLLNIGKQFSLPTDLQATCSDLNLPQRAIHIFNSQVLLLPMAMGATCIVSYSLKLLAEGLSSWSQRISPFSEQN